MVPEDRLNTAPDNPIGTQISRQRNGKFHQMAFVIESVSIILRRPNLFVKKV
jgi:hypothetical protein